MMKLFLANLALEQLQFFPVNLGAMANNAGIPFETIRSLEILI
jgi:hypothetical protein